jgi:hypothetical protein
MRLVRALARGGPRVTLPAMRAPIQQREVGIEGLTFSLPDVHDLETVALAGETLAPVFNPR